MRTLEHVVLSSRHPPNPTQRDPLNFIAPSPPLHAPSLRSRDMYIRPYTEGWQPLPSPIRKAEMAAARQIARRLAPLPPPLPPVRTSRGFRAGQAFELPFVPRLINFRGRHNPPPPFEGERKYVAMRKRGWRRRRKEEEERGGKERRIVPSRKTARARMIINGKLLSWTGKEGRGGRGILGNGSLLIRGGVASGGWVWL